MQRFRNGVICIAVLSAGFVVAFAFIQPVQPPPTAVRAPPVEPAPPPRPAPRVAFPAPTSQPVERRLAAGAVHVYPLAVKAGYYLELVVKQRGADLQVEVRDSIAGSSFIVDSPTGEEGLERVLLAPEEATVYLLEISERETSEGGGYVIGITTERPATDRDRIEAHAEAVFHQGKEALRSGDLRAAEMKLEDASRLWDRTGNLGRFADALQMLELSHRVRSDWKRSLELLLRTKSLFHRLGRFHEEGVVANDIGYVYERMGSLERARESCFEALDLGDRTRSTDLRAAALYNLGNIARRESRSREALENLGRARVIWKGLRNPREIDALSAVGGVFIEAGEIERAMPPLKEALLLAVSQDDFKRQASTLALIGDALHRANPEQARLRYEKAAEIQQRLGDLEGLASTLNGMGLLHLSQKQYQQALAPLQQALRIHEQHNTPLDEARTLTNLGFTFAGLGRERDARAAYEKAISQAGRDRLAEAAARAGLAQLEQELGNPIEAQKQAEAAVRSVEAMRASSRSDLRVRFLAIRQGIYGTLIEILMWQHELRPGGGFAARAFDVSELARTRGLLDNISGLETRSGVSASPGSLATHRSQIDPDTVLLEYHLGRDSGYLWIVDRGSLHVRRLPSRDRIEKLVTEARRHLSSRGKNLKAARRAATELSGALLKPAARWLNRNRLVISVPDSLQGLPFGVLPDPRIPDSAAERERWADPLILNHEIVKIPSLSVLTVLRGRAAGRKPRPNLLAVLFDPVFGPSDVRLPRRPVPSTSTRFSMEPGPPLGYFKRLRYSAVEAKAILDVAGPRNVLMASGFDASRDFVLAGGLRDSRNIHFTTHGRLQTQDADLSALVLSQFDSQGRPVDGLLRASDVVRLDLPADLVVLSACETGLGEEIPGEGLVGLPQAFMVAGASRVLVSLWPVDDLASSKLMNRFYHEYIAEGRSPAAALREAQIAIWRLRRYEAPFFWGAFELQGDWRPADPPR